MSDKHYELVIFLVEVQSLIYSNDGIPSIQVMGAYKAIMCVIN